jgi:hypothetical protein
MITSTNNMRSTPSMSETQKSREVKIIATMNKIKSKMMNEFLFNLNYYLINFYFNIRLQNHHLHSLNQS